jgi:putative membrane protein
MKILALTFTLITALLHLYFFILETFLWTTPFGLKVFKMKKEVAISSKALAANQGVYNAVLALGLLFSFFIQDATSGMAIRKFCLTYIVIVGCYGAYSLKNWVVFFIQALPALIALFCYF